MTGTVTANLVGAARISAVMEGFDSPEGLHGVVPERRTALPAKQLYRGFESLQHLSMARSSVDRATVS